MNNRIEEIKKRRDYVIENSPMDFDLPASRILLTYQLGDIDYLLAELDASKENADHLRESCEMLSESVVAAQAEVERLRTALKAVAEGDYCRVWEENNFGSLECPGCLVNGALCGDDADKGDD